jgi:hypothetical protein
MNEELHPWLVESLSLQFYLMIKIFYQGGIMNSVRHISPFIVSLLFTAISLFAQKKDINSENKVIKDIEVPQANGDKVSIKDENGNSLIEINDEGTFGSITLPDSSDAPSMIANKLYNVNGTLHFNGSLIGAVGADSLNHLADAKSDGLSIFIGVESGKNDDSGASDGQDNWNTAIGFYSLRANTTGYHNTASGYYSLVRNTSGHLNTSFGSNTMAFNTSGNSNTALGSWVLNKNNDGSYNTGAGNNALRDNVDGIYNSALGAFSLNSNTDGSLNTANGSKALNNNISGDKNTAVGYEALYYNIAGTGNVALGASAGMNETGSNKLYINNDSSSFPLIWGDFTNGSEIVKINGDFHVTGNITSDGSPIGVQEINDLADAIYKKQSLYLGEQSGGISTGTNNTAVGYASFNGGAGTENTALGWKAMQQVSSANYCTSIGSQALLTESGNYNTAIGYKALLAGTSTGTNNVAIGSNALNGSASPLSYNTAVGDFALNANQVDANTAVGYSSLKNNTTGINNVASGYESQFSNIDGNKNTSLGNVSGYHNIDGDENVTIGYAANYWRNSGSRNTIIGTEAGQGNPGTNFTASGNVFLGFQAGYFETGDNKLYINNDNSNSPLIWGDFTDGSEKVKINGEFETTGDITSQANQIAIGNNASATGSASFAFGSNAESSASSAYALGNNAKATSSSAIAIGTNTEANGTYAVAMGFNVETNGDFSRAIGSNVRVNAYGSMFLSDNSSATIHTTVVDNIFNARFENGYKLFTNSSLSVGAQMLAGANSWSVISDSTKKENFKEINGEDVLNKISEFNLRSWNYKGQDPNKYRHYGPMAQEFYNAFGNDGVGTVGNDTTIASADFDGINLIAIQALEKRTTEQNSIIDELKEEIGELKIKNSELTRINNELRSSYVELDSKIRNSSNIEKRLTELEILMRKKNETNPSFIFNN